MRDAPAKTVAQYIYTYCDKDGEEQATAEKTASLLTAFNTNTSSVIAAFKGFEGNKGYEDYPAKAAAAKELFDILQPQTLGDIDGDGDITANDALTILRASVGIESFTPAQVKIADIDSDSEITANDALAVLRYSVNMADEDSPINKPIAA